MNVDGVLVDIEELFALYLFDPLRVNCSPKGVLSGALGGFHADPSTWTWLNDTARDAVARGDHLNARKR